MINILKKIPLWGWALVAVGILFFMNYASSTVFNRSLFNIALDQIREDKTAIVDNLRKDQEQKAKEITELENRIKSIQQQRVAAEVESQRLARLVNDKNAEILHLKKERDTIVVPTDVNALADEFRKRGYKPRVIFFPR